MTTLLIFWVPLSIAAILLIASYPEFWTWAARRRARWMRDRDLELREMVWTCPCGYTLTVVGFSAALMEQQIAAHNDSAHGGTAL